MGHRVNSLIGISSCPLTATARFVKLFSRLGFDILTFKSVRSVEWHGNAYPHWRHVKANLIELDNLAPPTLTGYSGAPDTVETSQVNSFGIHSVKPEYWQEEYELARKNLLPGQVLILSLMLTPHPGRTTVDDAKAVARFGNETSARIFEVNLSCPNTEAGGGLIYDDVEMSVRVCTAIKKAIGNKPLLVKVGFYRDQEKLKTFLKKTKGMISGLSTMNTYVAKVVNQDKTETFPTRSMAGLSGAAIRNLAMHQAKNALKFKKELRLKNFVIIGIGGVTKPNHFTKYLDMGTDAVQVAAGALADPYLAQKYKKSV
jgi:dihydroorotate dehydrogenase